jgi:two-component system LytT family response regulator
MQIRCIAIDDEPLALDLIQEYVSRFPYLTLIRKFEDAISASEFLRSTTVDLLFVDINMPDISGIDLVKSLAVKPMIIFTTAHRKFAMEGFELEAVDYLLKPISFKRFERTIHKIIEYTTYKKLAIPQQSGILFVRSEYQLVKINIAAIDYLESLDDYVKIHLEDEKYVLTLMTLKSMMEKLPEDRFKRIHRSYIISVNHLKSVLNRKAKLSSGLELPISDSYASFMDEWKNP